MAEQQRHGLLREGVTTGFLGATAVAVWFLIVDLVHGQALHTPATLGRVFFSLFGPEAGETTLQHVLGYTVFHYLAFMVVGTILAAILRQADSEPSVLAGALIFFFVFQLAVFGLVSLLSEKTLLGDMAWAQIFAANIVASVIMGWYLWRQHPRAVSELAQALGGRE